MVNKICLNMIVKNECANILTCLKSCLPIIDAISITDTGSSDNTIEIINQFGDKHNIPHEVQTYVAGESYFDYSHNRNIALRYGEDFIDSIDSKKHHNWYFMFMDADNVLTINNFDKSTLQHDMYYAKFTNVFDKNHDYSLMVKYSKHVLWMEYIHEYPKIISNKQANNGFINTLAVMSGRTGCRSQNHMTHLSDYMILYHEMCDYPNNAKTINDVIMTLSACGLHDNTTRLALSASKNETFIPERRYDMLMSVVANNIANPLYNNKIYPIIFELINIMPDRLEAYYYLFTKLFDLKLYSIILTLADRLLSDKQIKYSIIGIDVPIYQFNIWYLIIKAACHIGNVSKIIQAYSKITHIPDTDKESINHIMSQCCVPYGKFNIFCNMHCLITKYIKAYGSWESQIIDIYTKLLNSKSVVIDIGAHIGTHTLMLSDICFDGMIHSFEPTKETFTLLQHNIRINKVNNVKLYNMALTEEVGNMSNDNILEQFNTGLPKYSSDSNGSVMGIPLDMFNFKPNLIKIDVEEAEVSVILGAINTIKKHKPIIIWEAGAYTAETVSQYKVYQILDSLSYNTQCISNHDFISRPT